MQREHMPYSLIHSLAKGARKPVTTTTTSSQIKQQGHAGRRHKENRIRGRKKKRPRLKLVRTDCFGCQLCGRSSF